MHHVAAAAAAAIVDRLRKMEGVWPTMLSKETDWFGDDWFGRCLPNNVE